MSGRQSKRLRGEEPEINQLTYRCFICQGVSECCDMHTLQLPCCKGLVHSHCQERWKRESRGRNCGRCRTPLNQEIEDQRETARLAMLRQDREFREMTFAIMNTNREELRERWRPLLESEELEGCLQQVLLFPI